MKRVFVIALVVGVLAGSNGQPTGSNPGLPPSAKATGLAPQFIQSAAVTQTQEQHSWTSTDTLAFLINGECLEARFDSYGAWGIDMHPDLVGGPESTAIGGKKANLSPEIRDWVEEVARDEIGHVRIIREALGADAPPCPVVDFTAFEVFFNKAFGTSGVEWDPFKNDINFVLSMFALEELGATGDQGVTLFNAYNLAHDMGNLTHVAVAAGLAGSAGYQSAADRYILWERRKERVPEFDVSVEEAFDKISALRQSWSGSAILDQGLSLQGGINVVPTDGNGVTLARTPQQVLNVLTFGSFSGKGGFLPEGTNGRIQSTRPLDAYLPPAVLDANNAKMVVVETRDEAHPLEPAVAVSGIEGFIRNIAGMPKVIMKKLKSEL